MIEAYTEDIKRVVSVTPAVDVSGQTILAKVYKDEEYVGVANTVRPEPETSKAEVVISNNGQFSADVTITLLSKYRHENSYTQIKEETISLPDHSAFESVIVEFDQEDKEDVEVEVSLASSDLELHSINVQQSQFNDLNGLVVGGPANEEVAIPCDLRRFVPGDDYSLVFVASNYGVIGRSIMVLYGKDGYSTEPKDEET